MLGNRGLIAGYFGCAFAPRQLKGPEIWLVTGESAVARAGDADALKVIELDDAWARRRLGQAPAVLVMRGYAELASGTWSLAGALSH